MGYLHAKVVHPTKLIVLVERKGNLWNVVFARRRMRTEAWRYLAPVAAVRRYEYVLGNLCFGTLFVCSGHWFKLIGRLNTTIL